MTEIFLPSDLNRRGRAVLNAARNRGARIRDTDGTSLIILPEEKVQALEGVARAASNLARLEAVLEQNPTTGAAFNTLDWSWLRVFDPDDLREFVRDIREGILTAFRDESPRVIEDLLHQWRVTAQSLEDPLRRSILYGPLKPDDYVEVPRPEAPG